MGVRKRHTVSPNLITLKKIRRGARYFGIPKNINFPNRRYVVPLTTQSTRRLIRRTSGAQYNQIPIGQIPVGNVLFKHPTMHNRNVLSGNLMRFVKPLYTVKTPKRTPTPKKKTPTPKRTPTPK